MSFLTRLVTTRGGTTAATRLLVHRTTTTTTSTTSIMMTARRFLGSVQDPPLGGFHEPSNRVADKSQYPPPPTTNLAVGASTTSTTTGGEDLHQPPPGSRAFVECDRNALIDLFHKYAVDCDVSGRYLDLEGLRKLLRAVGENLDQATLERLFATADINGDGTIELTEFLHGSDMILGGAPAGIVLVIGGPGSGKGVLSKRLEEECGVVHLSSGDLLRDEVRRDTILGRQVRDIMARGELVSSAVIVTLMRRVMRNHPGKRVLLDGFPRSIQNAHDLVELCGTPELALHLECDDTILMERILKRGEQANQKAMEEAKSHGDGGTTTRRADDNIHTALKRLRTYHKYHNSTLEWLRENHVPVVNLDCSGSAESVWEQLCAIGRLMRPATKIPASTTNSSVGSGGAAPTSPPPIPSIFPDGEDKRSVG